MPPPSRTFSRRTSLVAGSSTTMTITTSASSRASRAEISTDSRSRNLSVRPSTSASTSPRNPTFYPSRSSSSLRSSACSSSRPPPSPSRMQSGRSPSLGRTSSMGSRSNTPTLNRKTSTSSLYSASGITPTRTPSRRVSSASALSPLPRSPLLSAHPPPTIDEVPSAEAIAADHFQSDLAAHGSPDDYRHTDLVVVLNDACYGHRFSRPRTSRMALNMIVERPERVRAAALGIAMAYVRLGGRHADGHNPVHPRVHPTSLDRFPFRVCKTDRRVGITTPTVTNVHGQKWMEELKMMCDSAEARLAADGKELQRPDIKRDPEAGAPAKLHEGDLYLCAESLDAFEGALGAVCEAVDLVFSGNPRRAFVGVRPPGHHCSSSLPSGFCWINNVQVGIMHAAMNHHLTHAAIIDIDLHHGDGSQAITWAHNKRAEAANKTHSAWKRSHIGYFSLHDINSYPCEQGDEDKVRNASVCIDGAHGQHVWNMHLRPWKTEEEFWVLYNDKYLELLDKARQFLKSQSAKLEEASVEPKAAIFVSTGFDASEWESAGMQRHRVNVPTEFYARIAQDVVRLAAEYGTAVDGRVISVMEGGYSDRALSSGVLSHLSGLAGDQLEESVAPVTNYHGLGAEMGLNIGLTGEIMPIDVDEPAPPRKLSSLHSYDPNWWSRSELERMEALLMPEPVVEIKKVKVHDPPTFSAPTAASAARKVELRLRKSTSNLSINSTYSRPATPPPPDIMWEVAAFELVKQLIPLDRPTESYQVEDLNAEATRTRREKVQAAEPTVGGSKMNLRERKKPGVMEEKTTRRRTMSTTVVNEQPRRTSTRRVSAASIAAPSSYDAPVTASGRTRPSTSMSVRAQPSSSATLNVKRSRPSVSASSPSPDARKPLVSGGRTPAQRPGTASSRAPSITSTSTTTTRPPTTSPTSTVESVDQITARMKRIKINLITREERERRARQASPNVSPRQR